MSTYQLDKKTSVENTYYDKGKTENENALTKEGCSNQCLQDLIVERNEPIIDQVRMKIYMNTSKIPQFICTELCIVVFCIALFVYSAVIIVPFLYQCRIFGTWYIGVCKLIETLCIFDIHFTPQF